MVTRRTIPPHTWQFRARFRRHAFGWRSQPAVTRVREAVGEIRVMARRDPVLAADGAVLLIERLSPALEQVDSSSGAIGTAVNHAIDDLVPLIGDAPADDLTRSPWLERLWAALEADEIPYIESLGDHWGELCGSADVASAWADRFLPRTQRALTSRPGRGRDHFAGTSACLSSLHRAGRHRETLDLLNDERFWPYRRYAVMALVAMGKQAEAIRFAEESRDRWTSDAAVDRVCEEILLAAGLADEAYRRYALTANRASTYLATFRAVVRKYPDRSPASVLADLAATMPGEEGKWFAAAKSARLNDTALELARSSPCDPKTLTRAARDWARTDPPAGVEAGLLALHWIIQGHGFEITPNDVWEAYWQTMAAAEQAETTDEVRQRVKELLASEGTGGFVVRTLQSEVTP
jgi:hypothetical protein